jgi:serine protease Do
MSVTSTCAGRGWRGPLLLMMAALFATPHARAAAGVAAEGHDSLIRVRLEQRFPGLFHEGRLISQSTVVEVNEFNGVVLDNQGHVASFIGSTWANLAVIRPAASLLLPDGTETPAELVGVDERISLAVLRSPGLVGRGVSAGDLDLEKRTALFFWTEKGWREHPLQVVRAMSSDFDAERDVRVRLGDAARGQPLADGGILLDSAGRFLGFVTQLERGGVSPSLRSMRVIPVQAARESMREVLDRGGSVRAGWLGVFMDGGTPKVRIQEVVEDSPAARSGLQAGDLIREVGGATVWSDRQFVKLIRWSGPGSRIELTVERGGSVRKLAPVLAEWPVGDRPVLAWAVKIPQVWKTAGGAPEPQEIQLYRVPVGSIANLGLVVDPLTPQLARFFRSPSGRGLLVKTVLEGTPASKLGIQAGDVLLEINDLELESAADIRRVIEASGDGVLSITFLRGGEPHSRRVVLH